ncbi:chy zinc finger domain-containing protein [Diplodia corticola]|uniref:Chy zinc finger domain-containing protein n=1 Tax=Diplodia corticola TaxID=236234 RepID=A0A1J9QZZ7_9PEZI|nr:chy zinc finger domain-containing protein [Diplodia corticola]OJD33570.1 chy zinc finger domain-containing protein [Diplodia corticola]
MATYRGISNSAQPTTRGPATRGSRRARQGPPARKKAAAPPAKCVDLHLLAVVLPGGGVSRWSAAFSSTAPPSVPSFQLVVACLAGLLAILRFLMTNLISSFIIEPVVRHARRFSEATASQWPGSHGESTAIPDESRRPSRVSGSYPSPRREATSLSAGHVCLQGAAASQSVAGAAGSPQPAPPATATATATAPSQRSDFATVHTPEPAHESPEDPPRSTAAAGHARLTQLPASTTAASSRTASLPLEDERSSNPAHGIPAPFRPVAADSPDAGRPPWGSATANHQTGRDPARAMSYPPAGVASAEVKMSESLPADDGMRLMRLRIHEIRSLGVPSDEKARRMHSLMTEGYHARHSHAPRPPSPSSIMSNERPFTPSSTRSEMHISSPNSVYSLYDGDNPYNLTAEDLKSTFYPDDEAEYGVDAHARMDEDEVDDEGPIYGCKHYKRNVKIQCFDCNRWYTCRHCHDESENHHLNRKKTRSMFCMLCATPQPAGEFCRSCHARTAWYYCDICKLWDNDSAKGIYHCADCGICRRGEGLGKDFIHCKKCNVCISIKFAEDHRCIERATDADCPICKDYMFTSSTDVVAMKCGHYMHRNCYDAYMQTDYKCPMCKKSAVNMELQWRKVRDAVDSQPMPAQFADTKVVVHCNDCSVKSTAQYHWLGNQCTHCESFNTNELRLLSRNGPERDLGAADSTTTPSSPRSCLTPVTNTVERRTSGSYFLLAEREEREAREREAAMRPASADGSSFSPFEMLQRVRSLSPVRRLLGGSDDEMDDADEDEDDDDGEEDSDDSMDDDDEDEDEELEDADGDDILDGIDLIGHR